jgi:hypothetical protein
MMTGDGGNRYFQSPASAALAAEQEVPDLEEVAAPDASCLVLEEG